MLCFLCQHLMLSVFSALAMLEYTGSIGSLLHSSQDFPGGLGCYLLPWSLPDNVSVQSFACFLLGPLSCSYSHTLPLSPFLSFCCGGGDARKPWWSLICRLLLVLCSEKMVSLSKVWKDKGDVCLTLSHSCWFCRWGLSVSLSLCTHVAKVSLLPDHW